MTSQFLQVGRAGWSEGPEGETMFFWVYGEVTSGQTRDSVSLASFLVIIDSDQAYQVVDAKYPFRTVRTWKLGEHPNLPPNLIADCHLFYSIWHFGASFLFLTNPKCGTFSVENTIHTAYKKPTNMRILGRFWFLVSQRPRQLVSPLWECCKRRAFEGYQADGCGPKLSALSDPIAISMYW